MSALPEAEVQTAPLLEVEDLVVEFGPVSKSIHAIDEHVRLADIDPLSAVYEHAVRNLLEV